MGNRCTQRTMESRGEWTVFASENLCNNIFSLFRYLKRAQNTTFHTDSNMCIRLSCKHDIRKSQGQNRQTHIIVGFHTVQKATQHTHHITKRYKCNWDAFGGNNFETSVSACRIWLPEFRSGRWTESPPVSWFLS